MSRLEWRFATKKFEQSKKIGENDLNQILEATRMAPSSFGIQPYHVIVIEDKFLRERLLPHSYNQPQIIDASHLLVFASRIDLRARINEYIEIASSGDEGAKLAMAEYKKMMEGSLCGLDTTQAKSWADRQTHIALAFAIAAAMELGIDSCPMEGFNPSEYDKVLGLPDTLKSVVLLTLGYRSAGPVSPKVRFPKSDLFTKK